MWLPATIYERLPLIWLFIGVMIVAFGLYLGFDYSMIYAYLGLGAICLVYSAWLFVARRKHREKTSESSREEKNRGSDHLPTN